MALAGVRTGFQYAILARAAAIEAETLSALYTGTSQISFAVLTGTSSIWRRWSANEILRRFSLMPDSGDEKCTDCYVTKAKFAAGVFEQTTFSVDSPLLSSMAMSSVPHVVCLKTRYAWPVPWIFVDALQEKVEKNCGNPHVAVSRELRKTR